MIMLDVVTETRDADPYAQLHSDKGRMYRKKVAGSHAENLAKALVPYNVALRAFQNLGETLQVAEQYSNIADVYRDAGS